MDLPAEGILIIFVAVTVILASMSDIRSQKIPNYLTFPVMVAAFFHYSMTRGIDGAVFSMLGLFSGIALLLLPYLMGGLGAADVKLMGAVGSVVGVKGVVIATLFTALAGGVYALGLLIINRAYAKDLFVRVNSALRTYAVTGRFLHASSGGHIEKPRLRYGVAIAVGTLSYIYFELSGYQLTAL
jgi:prepilin peptidase CpaA